MTLYDCLQVSETACPEVIEAAWKALLRLCHPDLNPGVGPETAQVVNQAHDILSDPVQRQRYDEQLVAARMAPQFMLRSGSFGLGSTGSFFVFDQPWRP